MERQEATETSPLLPKPNPALPHSGLTPNSVPPSEIGATRLQDGDAVPAEDEESQSNGEDRGPRYEGMPDVKAKLMYILPALGIGVRLHRCIDSRPDIL